MNGEAASGDSAVRLRAAASGENRLESRNSLANLSRRAGLRLAPQNFRARADLGTQMPDSETQQGRR